MNEREIIIDILAASYNEEAHPEFIRVAMEKLNTTQYVHKAILPEVLKLEEEFKAAFDGKTLKDYYYRQSPQSLIECFDGLLCHKYR